MVARGRVTEKLTRDDIPTPALLLDLDAFEWNVAKMAGHQRPRIRTIVNFAETIVTFQFTPATPFPLFAFAPIVPDMWVPWASTDVSFLRPS